jgi:hypothetical protein
MMRSPQPLSDNTPAYLLVARCSLVLISLTFNSIIVFHLALHLVNSYSTCYTLSLFAALIVQHKQASHMKATSLFIGCHKNNIKKDTSYLRLNPAWPDYHLADALFQSNLQEPCLAQGHIDSFLT